ncbi:MAG TPA: lytic transglycosylase domain-containing protein [Thermoanaerobaculia bacterium]|nr:lytic transglycosylase domain-containing protein [Thermoanaerobaculia bacterium]
MRSRALWGFGLCATLLAGCATGSRITKITYSNSSYVKSITYTDIEPEGPPAPPRDTAPPAVSATGELEEENLLESVTPEERADGPLPVLGAQISPKEALAKALAWTIDGLRQYERGEIEAAHKSLNDAHLIFLEADLPDPLEAQGLNFFKTVLPEELQRFDVEAVARTLSRKDRLSTAELAERALIEWEVRSLLQFGGPSSEERYSGVLIDETYQYVQFFRGRLRQFFASALLRKYKYWPTIQEVFTAKNVPLDFGYLAFVESGFKPQAVSPANAIGLWQFIPPTGQRYGLRSLEDFHDVRKSTSAAATYLLELRSIFGSSLLALAAYNAGEGKVIGCLRRLDVSEKRSFWEIRGCLKNETREYVPKVLAAAVIGTDPKRFGFDLPNEEEVRRHYDVVQVPEITSLDRLAELAGVDPASLRRANTELAATAAVTPGRNFPLYVPIGRGATLTAALAAAPNERPPSIAPIAPVEMAHP